MEIKELSVKKICQKCGKESDRDGYYCSSCVNKKKQYERETLEFCKAYKICPVCKKEKLFGTEKHCPECRAKNTERKRRYRYQHLEESREYQRKTYYKLKFERENNGLCTRCGKEKSDSRYKLCAMCRYKKTERYSGKE